MLRLQFARNMLCATTSMNWVKFHTPSIPVEKQSEQVIAPRFIFSYLGFHTRPVQVGIRLYASDSTSKEKSIEERILKILSCFNKKECKELTMNTHFVQDMGLDSLDQVELIMTIEDEFGFQIPDEAADKMLKPADIVRFISVKKMTCK